MFEQKHLELRRFEIQVHYHAAYLFWNLKGAIAERWAHGPHFGAYATDETKVTLSVRAGEPSPLVGVYGLKFAALNAERYEWEEAVSIAQLWFHDCLEVLSPRVTTRMFVKAFYSYPTERPGAVSQAIGELYPGLTNFVPAASNMEVHGGLQFQTLKKSPRGQREDITSAVFGVYGPHQASLWFVTSDPEGQWALGLDYLHQANDPEGFADPQGTLSELIEATRNEVHLLRTGSLQKTLNSLGGGSRG